MTIIFFPTSLQKTKLCYDFSSNPTSTGVFHKSSSCSSIQFPVTQSKFNFLFISSPFIYATNFHKSIIYLRKEFFSLILLLFMQKFSSSIQLLFGISRACAHLFARCKCSSLKLLQHPPMHSCCSCYALVVKLLLLGEGIVGKFKKRKRTDKHRQTDGF